MAGDWTWLETDGSETPVSLEWNNGDFLTGAGELVSRDVDNNPVIEPLILSAIGEPAIVDAPLAPIVTGSMISQTQSDVDWIRNPTDDSPAITSWIVQRSSSTDNGATYGAFTAVAGSPFAANVLTFGQTGLATGTPFPRWRYRVRAVNPDGESPFASVTLQWGGATGQQPTAPTNFRLNGNTPTSRSFLWTVDTDTSVTKYGIFDDDVLVMDNIGPSLLGTTWTGLTPGDTYVGINVRRWNGEWSPPSNSLEFTQSDVTPPATIQMMGCSASSHGHGGTEAWEGWRVYNEGESLNYAERTGANHPKYICHGGPMMAQSGATENSVYNDARSFLDRFYYDNTASTHSVRWDVKLYYVIGNENYVDGFLNEPHTAAGITSYVNCMRGLYRACHYVEGGSRRYPLAFSGSNPTQEQERKGLVQAPLNQSALSHDFVVWSMYPPGRGVSDTAMAIDPRWDWPYYSISNDAQANNLQRGFLLRCFKRTRAARDFARSPTGGNTPGHQISISCGEIGIAADPDDRTTRPYYASRLAWAMFMLAQDYNLTLDFSTWWDSTTIAPAAEMPNPHNILLDEAPSCDHLFNGSPYSAGTDAPLGRNNVACNPSTREAWQHWSDYVPAVGGAHPPQWVDNPKISGALAWNNNPSGYAIP